MDNCQLNTNGIKVYPYRWVVLGTYLLIAAMIQFLWATFFSITTAAWKFYGFADAAKGETAISLLSLIFMVGMIVLSIPSMAAFEKWGFKKAVGFGALLMGVCGALRGFFGDSYTAVLITTFGFAVAQPFILNAPGLVAGKWFPENERATANGVALMANFIGIAIGLLIPPMLLDNGMTIPNILFIIGVASAVVAVLFLIFAREKPPTPPCSEEEAVRTDFVGGVKSAFKKRNFVISVLMFFCLFGVFNLFFTMIEPIIHSMTNGAVDATGSGILGVIILVMGMLGSLVVSAISDKDKRRRRLPYMIVCNTIGMVGLVLIVLLKDFTGMIIAGVLYGFFIVGSAPVVLTFAAETAYPTSEGTSEGLLMFAGNVAGAAFIGLAPLFGGNHLGIMLSLLAVSVVSVILMCIAKEDKLKQKANK
jgi:MFS family permease